MSLNENGERKNGAFFSDAQSGNATIAKIPPRSDGRDQMMTTSSITRTAPVNPFSQMSNSTADHAQTPQQQIVYSQFQSQAYPNQSVANPVYYNPYQQQQAQYNINSYQLPNQQQSQNQYQQIHQRHHNYINHPQFQQMNNPMPSTLPLIKKITLKLVILGNSG
jgi:hypothetical protein